MSITLQNQLLSRLSPEDRASIGPLALVNLPLRTCLEASDTPIEFVYFIETGLASVVEEGEGGAIEVGVIGSEGMSGTALIYGDDQTPFQTYMQSEGTAFRTTAHRLRVALGESPSLRALLALYARTFVIQVASTAYANGRASLSARLARWLLMLGDRMGDNFEITHEFLSTMLGVRRSGVTVALQELEGDALIKCTRGAIRIRDRDALIVMARGSYGMAEREYSRLLPALAAAPPALPKIAAE
jgi:CRP-like cAMP-binding protein